MRNTEENEFKSERKIQHKCVITFRNLSLYFNARTNTD